MLCSKKRPQLPRNVLCENLKLFVCVQTVQSRLKMVAALLFLQRPNFVAQTGLGFWPGPGNSAHFSVSSPGVNSSVEQRIL
jgi:hypothetical protein